jgi:hypothetical protein
LLPPPSLSSRSSRGVTSAPRHARSSRRAARRSARRRACSSSGPSARDDRGAADQGASRALGVAACAADLGDTAEVDAAPPRAAAPSRHARRSMFGKETSRCVACETPKVWSVDRFKCPTDQPAGNRKFRVKSREMVYLFQTSSHTNTSRRAAWEFLLAAFAEVEKPSPIQQPGRAETRTDEAARTREIRAHARSEGQKRRRAFRTLAVTARSSLPERGRGEFSRV